MRIKSLLTAGSLIIATACATAGGAAGGGTPSEITAADIEKANVATAYDAVDRLARRWFRDLSSNASGEVVVFLHTDQKLGGRETLRDIPARDVVKLNYLRSADAMARYGQDASGGAIIVTRR